MTPNNAIPPFFPDAIPLYLEADLWDETKPMEWRGFRFVILYMLSICVNDLLVFVPIAVVSAFRCSSAVDGILGTAIWWLLLSIPSGILFGFAVWWDFSRACRKLMEK